MIASAAYPRDDPIRLWKRGQTLFFASLKIPGVDDIDTDGADDDLTKRMAELGVSRAESAALSSLGGMSTGGAAAPSTRNVIRTVLAFYVLLLTPKVPVAVVDSAYYGRVAWKRIFCDPSDKLTTVLEPGQDPVCKLSDEAYAELMAGPKYNLRWSRTMIIGTIWWSSLPEVSGVGQPTNWEWTMSLWRWRGGRVKSMAQSQFLEEAKTEKKYNLFVAFSGDVFFPSALFLLAIYVAYYFQMTSVYNIASRMYQALPSLSEPANGQWMLPPRPGPGPGPGPGSAPAPKHAVGEAPGRRGEGGCKCHTITKNSRSKTELYHPFLNRFTLKNLTQTQTHKSMLASSASAPRSRCLARRAPA